MEQQKKFLALGQQERFVFLYLAVKENEQFIIRWMKEYYIGDSETKENSQQSIRNAFDFLGKLILPGIKNEYVINKELMLNGMADDILSICEEVSGMVKANNFLRASAAIAAVEVLYTCIIDSAFSPEEYDQDNCPFQVILLSALGNYLYNDFQSIMSDIKYDTSWDDIEILDRNYTSLKTLFREFMDSIFARPQFSILT
ncbi:hypothetical protein [Pedobacter sp. ASV28]|uniref:hypothetical protein n=1 Tax=Pedobacter sp. ASV28 TaxID=2795123 RepID=UPI0018EB589D|nr:hypothetical protein [Pedobacter sp. ASV28]